MILYKVSKTDDTSMDVRIRVSFTNNVDSLEFDDQSMKKLIGFYGELSCIFTKNLEGRFSLGAMVINLCMAKMKAM